MCAETGRASSPAEEAYIEARKDVILLRDRGEDATNAERRAAEAADAIRDETGPIDSTRGWSLIDAAIERSGLGEDSPTIQHTRYAQTAALQVEEAVANGANRRLAIFVAAVGIDPRKVRELYD